ncbi:MAG: outer membrane protein assembly factor BamB [Oceanospirillaceae bacterium]|nr:outer membrane protein assembly factor BamB [Oceanospirillaceae bacterium]MBT14057.1 outer membrane protein assembly factor BamB [Oceanospirillaceae bacterium]|tara:strand:- start:1768 stop:2985 length:1218 start_codon:yes stop_codon:yes gene_type:complete
MRRLLLPVLFSALLAACASQPENETADAAESGLPDFNNQTDIDIKWRENLGTGPVKAYTRLRPLVLNSVVYAADPSGTLVALDLDDGDEIWSTDLGIKISAAVSGDNGQLFVATFDGYLHCLDAGNGEEIWQSRLTSEAVAPAGMDPGRVYVQTVDGRVSAFERSNGRQAWSYENAMPVLSVRGTGTPLVMDQFVVAGFATGKVLALDKALGVPRWEVRLATPDGRSELERLVDIDGTPAQDSRVIYAASYHGKVAAITPDGESRWQEDGSTYTSPALGLGNVYLTLDDGTVQAYDQNRGAKVWTQKGLRDQKPGQVTTYRNWLLSADSDGYLHVMSQVDGELVGRILLRPRPLHVSYPNQTEGTNWRALRGVDLGIRSPLVATSAGVLVYTNAGELLLIDIEAD